MSMLPIKVKIEEPAPEKNQKRKGGKNKRVLIEEEDFARPWSREEYTEFTLDTLRKIASKKGIKNTSKLHRDDVVQKVVEYDVKKQAVIDVGGVPSSANIAVKEPIYPNSKLTEIKIVIASICFPLPIPRILGMHH